MNAWHLDKGALQFKNDNGWLRVLHFTAFGLSPLDIIVARFPIRALVHGNGCAANLHMTVKLQHRCLLHEKQSNVNVYFPLAHLSALTAMLHNSSQQVTSPTQSTILQQSTCHDCGYQILDQDPSHLSALCCSALAGVAKVCAIGGTEGLAI